MAIASIFSDFSVFVLLFSTISAVPPPIQQACKATRYPQTCQASLLQSTLNIPSNPTPTHIIQAVLSVSSQKTTSTQSMVHDILLSSSHNHNRSMAATTCLELLHMSAIRTFTSSSSLARGNIKDARAFAGAALAYQYDCWSELYYVNGTHQVNQTMSFLDTSLMPSTSNALSMMMALDNAGPDTRSWDPPKTERDGFWERVGSRSGSDHDLGFPIRFPAVKKADATVCKGSKAKGCYGTVQEAVEAAPEKLGRGRRWVIHVREGVYEERVRVPLEKTNLVLVGDGMGKTVITGSVNTGILGISTYNTATVGVLGDGFMASGITFENKAGPNAHQAVAFRSDSDFSLVENCEFLGNQDTLYAHSLRQIYRKCLIQGNVDFIFGNAAAIFQNCTILVRPRLMNPTDGENNAITASGRTDPAEPTGFVFLGCLINGTNEYMRLYHSNPIVHKNYLGRPWKTYARTVFINCVIEELISPEGWMPFRGDLGLSTLYYGEFGNKGPGANLKGRVRWSSWIPAQHLNVYSTGNFLQADEWISASPSNVGLMRDWN